MPHPVLRIGVMELRRRPGTQRDVRVATTLPGLHITGAQVPDDAELVVDATLESIEGAGHRDRHRRRCRGRRSAGGASTTIGGVVTVDLSEVFEVHPVDGETYPIEGDEVDLEPVVRDAALLHLPLAPLCRPDCAGPAPDAFPATVEGDERRRPERAARATPAGPPSTSSPSTGLSPSQRPQGPFRRSGEPAASVSRLCCRAGISIPAPARPVLEVRITDGRPQEEDLQGEEPQPPGQRLDARGARAERLPAVRRHQAPPRRLRELRLVRRPPGHRRRLSP